MLQTILSTILGGVGVFLIQRWVQNRPQGTSQQPLPAPEGEPRGTFVEPTEREVSPEQVYDELTRAFPDLTPEQADPLIGMFLIATKDGQRVVSNNVANVSATAEWDGAWTKIRKTVVADDGQPAYQWRNIRAYPTLSLGVQDWLGSLPDRALESAQVGNIDGFAAALVDAGKINMDAGQYADYLAEAVEAHWIRNGHDYDEDETRTA